MSRRMRGRVAELVLPPVVLTGEGWADRLRALGFRGQLIAVLGMAGDERVQPAQARVEVENLSMRIGGLAAGTGPGASVQSARLLGDYQLDALRFGQTGGLRLTSGLLLAQRQGLSTADTETRPAWPYVGPGYSGNGPCGAWGVGADFGMAAQSLGATLRLGRVVNGGLSVGDALRDLRLQPVVRLGVTYNF